MISIPQTFPQSPSPMAEQVMLFARQTFPEEAGVQEMMKSDMYFESAEEEAEESLTAPNVGPLIIPDTDSLDPQNNRYQEESIVKDVNSEDVLNRPDRNSAIMPQIIVVEESDTATNFVSNSPVPTKNNSSYHLQGQKYAQNIVVPIPTRLGISNDNFAMSTSAFGQSPTTHSLSTSNSPNQPFLLSTQNNDMPVYMNTVNDAEDYLYQKYLLEQDRQNAYDLVQRVTSLLTSPNLTSDNRNALTSSLKDQFNILERCERELKQVQSNLINCSQTLDRLKLSYIASGELAIASQIESILPKISAYLNSFIFTNPNHLSLNSQLLSPNPAANSMQGSTQSQPSFFMSTGADQINLDYKSQEMEGVLQSYPDNTSIDKTQPMTTRSHSMSIQQSDRAYGYSTYRRHSYSSSMDTESQQNRDQDEFPLRGSNLSSQVQIKKSIMSVPHSFSYETSIMSQLQVSPNLQLVRVYIDDEAGRYISRLALLPFLRDPNYKDDESLDYERRSSIDSSGDRNLSPGSSDQEVHSGDELRDFEQSERSAKRARETSTLESSLDDFDNPPIKRAKRSVRRQLTTLVPSNKSRSKATIIDLSDIVKPFSNSTTSKPKYFMIGEWQSEANEYREILAKFHHSKKHLVWQITDKKNSSSTKFLLNYSDVSKITVHDVTLTSNPTVLVAVNFSLNARPRLFQEAPTQEVRHTKSWIKAEHDFTFEAASTLPQVHTLIFEKRMFTERHNNNLSQLERLILGDPYFTRIVRIDSSFTPIGQGFLIVGRRSMEQLRDKLLHFLETLHHYIEIYSAEQLSLSINFHVHHTFKQADTSRMESKPHEASIAINFEDISAIAQERGDEIISREELQYYMHITKIGENGICSFRHQSGAPTKAGGKLSPSLLVETKKFKQNQSQPEILNQTPGQLPKISPGKMDSDSAQPESFAPLVTQVPDPFPDSNIGDLAVLEGSKKKSRGRTQRGANEPPPKNIRVAMMFSKARLVAVCGSEVTSLWANPMQ